MNQPDFQTFHHHGWLEVICGCMFSGKTEELIRQIRRTAIAKIPFKVFKPRIDNRYSATDITSHGQNKLPAIVIDHPLEIFERIDEKTRVIGIDEGQFFSADLIAVVNKLVSQGRRVIVAGLDTDWQGKPFGPMPQLMAVAEVVKKQAAVCIVCGGAATRTQRTIQNGDDILVGSTDLYEARCRYHHRVERPQASRAHHQIST